MPKLPDGRLDREAIKALFMASKFLDWTRFAEEQEWDPFLSRRDMPVKSWIKEKRDILTEKQMDILSAIVLERKFTWTHAVIKTLDEYPEFIDMGMQVAKAKLSQIADLFRDYQLNFIGKEDKMYRVSQRGGRKIRITHPFEKLSGGQVGSLLAGVKSITDAKLKALMLDKWAITKLDLPVDQPPTTEEDGAVTGPTFTVEGKGEIPAEDFQKWMDDYLDKPVVPPTDTTIMVKPPVDTSTEDGS